MQEEGEKEEFCKNVLFGFKLVDVLLGYQDSEVSNQA